MILRGTVPARAGEEDFHRGVPTRGRWRSVGRPDRSGSGSQQRCEYFLQLAFLQRALTRQELRAHEAGGGPDEASQTVTLSATSSNTALLPDPVASGTGATRTRRRAFRHSRYGLLTIDSLR